MENNIQPPVDLPINKPINLNRILPKNEWWSLWYYIFNGKLAEVKNNN